MNLGWIRRLSSGTDIRRLVLHEFGHALGLFHEHKPRKTPLKYIADSRAFDDYYILEKGMRVPGINLPLVVCCTNSQEVKLNIPVLTLNPS